MSAQTRTLIEIKEVTDHDCGNYTIGEIDFGIHGTLSSYLKTYGYEGKKEILHILGVLAAQVQIEFNNLQNTQAQVNNGK